MFIEILRGTFATPEHPFYVKEDNTDGTKQGNWIGAGSLKKGLKIALVSGLLANVESIYAIDTTATVYNFEVEKTHTYYVGTEGVLVHNSCESLAALREIQKGASNADWIDFTSAISSTSPNYIPASLRVPFYTELAKLDEAAFKAFINEFKVSDATLRLKVIKQPALVEELLRNSISLFRVDDAFKAGDIAAGVLVDGKYLKNPTATKVENLIINPSGTIKGKTRLDPNATTIELLNGGEYMYIIDDADNLIIGTRAKGFNFSNPDGKAPHPTLLGGADPTVRAAGTIDIRGGKIYKVDNASGHFKPSINSLKKAEEIFRKKFLSNSFSNDFKGFLLYGE